MHNTVPPHTNDMSKMLMITEIYGKTVEKHENGGKLTFYATDVIITIFPNSVTIG